jgi:hypothetical protein
VGSEFLSEHFDWYCQPEAQLLEPTSLEPWVESESVSCIQGGEEQRLESAPLEPQVDSEFWLGDCVRGGEAKVLYSASPDSQTQLAYRVHGG